MEPPHNTLAMAHDFLSRYVQPGSFCIDATAGRGRDTALLCRLAGPTGKVLALDIQEAAVKATRELLAAEGHSNASVILDGHQNLRQYAQPGTVDAIVFNLGWLPGSDHNIRTGTATTLPALEQSLDLLRPGGVLSLCLYYGGISGYDERDAVLRWLQSVDSDMYTVVVSQFVNRAGDVPIPVFIWRHKAQN